MSLPQGNPCTCKVPRVHTASIRQEVNLSRNFKRKGGENENATLNGRTVRNVAAFTARACRATPPGGQRARV